MTEEHGFVRWKDVEISARALFNVWTDQPELEWAAAAWRILERKGLTNYANEVDRAVITVRLIALAAFYHSFCRVAHEEGSVDLRMWAIETELNKARLLQIDGLDLWSDVPFDLEALLQHAYEAALEKEYPVVTNAVVEELGGTSLTFLSLWLSNNHDWSGRTDVPHELSWEVQNESVDWRKMGAVGWLETGYPIDPQAE